MNINELKQSLSTMADDADDDVHPTARLAAVDRKVSAQRRRTAVATGAAVAIAVAAVAIAPNIIDRSADTVPADRTDPLPTVSQHGVSLYKAPGGARLIAYAVARPGEHSVDVTFTPTTSDLSWTDFCYDAGVSRIDTGAEFGLAINGHELSWSTCNGTAEGPLGAEGGFAESPTANARVFSHRYGVRAGQPSTVTVHLTRHVDRGVAPQPGIAIYERAPRQQVKGIWFDREVVFKGHTYRILDADVATLNGRNDVRAHVTLPRSEQPLYAVTGAAHVRHGLQLLPDSVGVSPMGNGVTAAASGNLVPPDRGSVAVRAHPRNQDAVGDIFVLVYERIG